MTTLEKATQRKYDIDWLRTIIVLSIVPFHAFVIFNQDKGWVMFVKDKMDVPAFDFINNILSRFNMSTLFFLAGMAIFYSLQRRDTGAFLKQRVKKLFIPLLTGSLLLNPVMTYFWSMNQGRNENFPEHYIGFFTKDLGSLDGLSGGYTPAHLWFVLYLLLYSFMALPLFLWFKSDKSEKVKNKLAGFFYKPMTILLLTIPYCLLYLIEILDEKNPIAFLYIVVIGCLFATDDRYLRALSRDKWIYLIITLLAFILYFGCRPSSDSKSVVLYAYAFLVKLTKILPVLSLLGLFHCYVNKNTKALQYLSGASYTIYIIHLLIVTAVGYVVIQLSITPILKLLLIVTISYALCFLFYELLRRTKYVGVLFGISHKKK